MKLKRFTDEQIAFALRQAESGVAAKLDAALFLLKDRQPPGLFRLGDRVLEVHRRGAGARRVLKRED